jgi:hypothetical protein
MTLDKKVERRMNVGLTSEHAREFEDLASVAQATDRHSKDGFIRSQNLPKD